MSIEVGKRIREERQRLGLSQSVFAEKVGIHRNTQANYEAGHREPDTKYIFAITHLKVDVGYVLTGNPTLGAYLLSRDINPLLTEKEELQRTWGDDTFRSLILSILGISHDEWIALVKKVSESIEGGGVYLNYNDPRWSRGLVERSRLISGLLRRGEAIDVDLLSEILTRVDDAIQQGGLSISADKKSRAVALLYRSFKASQGIDCDVIAETVRLAAV